MTNSIYIAGPMRRIEKFNYPAFDAARDRFKSFGYSVVSPADLDRQAGISLEVKKQKGKVTNGMLREFMSMDLNAMISSCDKIALLPGWEKSSGVAVELALARYLGFEIYDAQTGALLETTLDI